MACKAIGIDLGTTYSSVAVWKNGRVEVIANNYGNRMTPSCVAFTEHGTLVGEAAKEQLASNPPNTVYAVKRLIGRQFSEQCVQMDMKSWTFEVVAGADDKPMIEVKVNGETCRYEAEDISSLVLEHMKKIAEKYIGSTVYDAVITIPANYGDVQRQATFEAARKAGLNVLRLINEPTAAALAYSLENAAALASRNMLVFDFGGGTLDVSILAVSEETLFEVKSTAGDAHLGGDDLDNRMVEQHFAAEFKRNNKVDISTDKRAVLRLAKKCERTKRALSENASSTFKIDCLFHGQDCFSKLTRTQFETMCDDLFQKTLVPVQQALEYAGLGKGAIDEIVLTGGSSRIPKIQQLLKKYFSGKRLNCKVNPDEAVAYGAAILAAKMSGKKTGSIHRVAFTDITGKSYGLKNAHGDSIIFIPRGSKIPIKVSQECMTADDYQPNAEALVYEGEQKKAKDNDFLGSFVLSGFPAKPKGEIGIDTTMEIDENEILHVTSVERSTGKKNHLSFTRRMV